MDYIGENGAEPPAGFPLDSICTTWRGRPLRPGSDSPALGISLPLTLCLTAACRVGIPGDGLLKRHVTRALGLANSAVLHALFRASALHAPLSVDHITRFTAHGADPGPPLCGSNATGSTAKAEYQNRRVPREIGADGSPETPIRLRSTYNPTVLPRAGLRWSFTKTGYRPLDHGDSHGTARSMLLAVFVLVEVASHVAGMTFDVSTLPGTWQFLDQSLLAHDLLRSLWYLHSQPPAFNLFLGIVLKVAGSHAPIVFHAAFLAMGWALCAGVLRLTEMIGATRRVATAAAVVIAVSPSFVLYEHWLFYTLPEAALLVWMAVGAGSLARATTPTHALSFSATVALLCLTRSVYHVAFAFAVLSAVVRAAPQAWRVLRCWSVVPAIAVLAVYVKNFLLFGTFATSSWMGMNVAKMTVGYLNIRDRVPLVEKGVLSSVSLIEPFSPVVDYPPSAVAPIGPSEVPAVASILKTNGLPNMNYGGLIGLSRIYQRDAGQVLRHAPTAYMYAVRDALWIYSWSATENDRLDPNRQRIVGWTRWWDRFVLQVSPGSSVAWTMVVANIAAIVGGLWFVLRSAAPVDARVGALVAMLSIIYVALAGNLLETGENNRFRFATDPLTIALLAALISSARLSLRSCTRTRCSQSSAFQRPPNSGNVSAARLSDV